MTNFRHIWAAMFILTWLLACGGEDAARSEPAKHETPKALQDEKSEVEYYSSFRSGNLVDNLYQELVGKTPALKQLEDDLKAINPKANEANDRFQSYDRKSTDYYSSANQHASEISDSLLKNKMLALIAANNQQYSAQTAELRSLLNSISKNSTSLRDQQTVLKIVLTMSLIEKYQAENKPDKKIFKDLIDQQGKLLQRIDSLSPKY